MSETIVVAFDPGTSQTRVVWGAPGHKLSFHLFSADCAPLHAARAPQQMGSDNFWVSCSRFTYVVGSQASDGLLSEGLKEGFKFEAAIPKVMAALHLVLEDCKQKQLEDVRIALTVLLPANERQSFQVLERMLPKHLSEFVCNDCGYRIELESLECLAEGLGIVRYAEALDPDVSRNKILTMMAGYRDISLIRSIGSQELLGGKTAPIGMLWMLKKLEEQVGQIDKLKASKVLHEVGAGNVRSSDCRGLSRATYSKALKAQDATAIARAAKGSRKTYLEYILAVFQGIPLAEVDLLIVAGGTGDYLLPMLQQSLNCKIWFPEPLVELVMNYWELERDLSVRLADVFAVASLHPAYGKAGS